MSRFSPKKQTHMSKKSHTHTKTRCTFIFSTNSKSSCFWSAAHCLSVRSVASSVWWWQGFGERTNTSAALRKCLNRHHLAAEGGKRCWHCVGGLIHLDNCAAQGWLNIYCCFLWMLFGWTDAVFVIWDFRSVCVLEEKHFSDILTTGRTVESRTTQNSFLLVSIYSFDKPSVLVVEVIIKYNNVIFISPSHLSI